MLWPLFGTCNQLLAGLVLLVASIYLIKKKTKIWPTAVPMFFMIITSGWAMTLNIMNFFNTERWQLVIIGSLIFLLEIWMIFEAIFSIKREEERI